MTLDAESATGWVNRAAAAVAENEEHLTQLDAAIGDGDHGANLSRGLNAAVAALKGDPPTTPGQVLIATGRALVSKTGGASGPLYGMGFRQAGKALAETTDADAELLGDALQAMLDGIQDLGGASVGDKTMVDALAPAVEEFRKASTDGASLAQAAARAGGAADAGRVATVPLLARKGRASYLGDRSIDHEDPGAASMTLVIRALAEVLEA